jgi:hypothetical protein
MKKEGENSGKNPGIRKKRQWLRNISHKETSRGKDPGTKTNNKALVVKADYWQLPSQRGCWASTTLCCHTMGQTNKQTNIETKG